MGGLYIYVFRFVDGSFGLNEHPNICHRWDDGMMGWWADGMVMNRWMDGWDGDGAWLDGTGRFR